MGEFAEFKAVHPIGSAQDFWNGAVDATVTCLRAEMMEIARTIEDPLQHAAFVMVAEALFDKAKTVKA